MEKDQPKGIESFNITYQACMDRQKDGKTERWKQREREREGRGREHTSGSVSGGGWDDFRPHNVKLPFLSKPVKIFLSIIPANSHPTSLHHTHT
jgi:hypothetical protein